MDLDRAKTISAVAQTIINVAKVEVEMVEAVGAGAPTDGFFQLPPPENRDVTGHARRIDERKAIAEGKKTA